MKKNFILFALLLLLGSCTHELADVPVIEKQDEMPFSAGISNQDIVNGVIHIKLEEKTLEKLAIQTYNGEISTGIPDMDKLAAALGATKIERTFGEGGRFEPRWRKAGLHLWYDVYFDEDIPVTRAYSNFRQLEGIAVVEPALKIEKLSSGSTPVVFSSIENSSAQPASHPSGFNDAQLGKQWHYYNDGSLPQALAGADINVVPAWKITTGHPDVIVAVVDEGVDYEHEDLAQNMWMNVAELNGAPGVDDDENGYIDDVHGWNFYTNTRHINKGDHGTHVAGTVAAVSNNGKGVAGVAGGDGSPNSGVRIMPTQIFTSVIGSDRNVYRAIVYGADNGAVISQNSWGIQNAAISELRKTAIDYFTDYAGMDETGEIQVGPMRGGLFIAAVGNINTSFPHMPAAYERVLGVVAMGPDFIKASYSNYGAWCNITAPGGDISRLLLPEYGVLSTYPDNQYAHAHGTSMACPHVSGVAALVVSKYGVGKKGFTNEMLWKILTESVNNIYPYNDVAYQGLLGTGYIDAHKALTVEVNYEDLPPKQVTDIAARWNFNSVGLEWSVTVDTEDETASFYDIIVSKTGFSTIDFNNPPAGAICKTVESGDKKAGEKLSVVIEGLPGKTTHYIAIAARDNSDNRSAALTYTGTTINDSQVNETIYPDINIVEMIDISEHFGKNSKLSYAVTSTPEGVIDASITQAGMLLLKHIKYGTGKTVVHATDGNGMTVDYIITSVCRDHKQEIDLYPNPVRNILNIRMGRDISGEIQIDIVNSMGIKVFSGKRQISPASPATVDMSKMSAGNYTVTITYENKRITRSISKL
ncbi:MAG: S8 family serine peptidase [Dysgonamonadaceae bacterium]|jgi:subtilisin family serine protease|nr:S8 family serine peptidase [Dysgonamonadaceae bacterium]